MKKNNNALFYTCSLIEFLARKTKNTRANIITSLGEDLQRIYRHADVFHCEPIEKVADDFIQKNAIPQGDFEVGAKSRYAVPDYWDMAEVFQRLIEDSYDEANVITGIRAVFSSWITEKLLNFNSDLYYQPREYLALCYAEGRIAESF